MAKYRDIDVWEAVYNLNEEYGVSWEDIARSLMGWQGDYEVRDWLTGRVERDYELTFDEKGNITRDDEDA
jgi:hypothetical protein